MRRFVGVNDAARGNSASNGHNGSIFRLEHEGQRATAAFAHDDNDAALAGLI